MKDASGRFVRLRVGQWGRHPRRQPREGDTRSAPATARRALPPGHRLRPLFASKRVTKIQLQDIHESPFSFSSQESHDDRVRDPDCSSAGRRRRHAGRRRGETAGASCIRIGTTSENLCVEPARRADTGQRDGVRPRDRAPALRGREPGGAGPRATRRDRGDPHAPAAWRAPARGVARDRARGGEARCAHRRSDDEAGPARLALKAQSGRPKAGNRAKNEGADAQEKGGWAWHVCLRPGVFPNVFFEFGGIEARETEIFLTFLTSFRLTASVYGCWPKGHPAVWVRGALAR